MSCPDYAMRRRGLPGFRCGSQQAAPQDLVGAQTGLRHQVRELPAVGPGQLQRKPARGRRLRRGRFSVRQSLRQAGQHQPHRVAQAAPPRGPRPHRPQQRRGQPDHHHPAAVLARHARSLPREREGGRPKATP